MVNHDLIEDTLNKMYFHFTNHDSIEVGVSGGSDSNIIVHMIATYFREFIPKIHFVFINTGLEYRATIRHLEYMEKIYNIQIEKIRGESVVSVVKREGIPIISKDYSMVISYAQRGSDFALKRIKRTREESAYAFSKNKKLLAQELLDKNIKISAKCCDYSKKSPHNKYCTKHKVDLKITGERQCEGGQRANAHSSCFEPAKSKYKIDKYMPLFFWDDDTKNYYKESEGIVYSDCYEVWGMERTGCVGCPFNSKAGIDLKIIKEYEPGLYRACLNIFGESYELMDRFNIRRHKILDDEMLGDLKEIRENKLQKQLKAQNKCT